MYTKEELFREIWDMESIGDIATVTVHIKKIREKIEYDTSHPQYIETIWGVDIALKCNGMTKTQFDFIFVMREKGFRFSELLFYCK